MSSLKDRSAARKGTGRKAAARQERRGAGRSKDHQPLLSLVKDLEARESYRRPAQRRAAPAKPLTAAQGRYDAAIASKILTFGIGPAGTGKTWLAATRAAEALAAGEIEMIIVTRPTIEAGEVSLGFLPGELEEKNEPYFRPVREALVETLGAGAVEMYLKNETIQARPLQFIRGATLKNAFVLVDEAQNLTKAEMKLLLSRLGENVTVVVDGDPDQADIKGPSGLIDAIHRFADHPDVGVVEFTTDDIVRSGFCRDVILAYAKP